MKKILSSLIIVSLLAPVFVFAAPPPIVSPDEGGSSFVGSPEYAADKALADTQTSIANLAASGEVVGCQSAGFGGALAQTFAAALQQAVPNFIRSQLQGPLSKLAAQAGPFGGLINAVGNMAINKLSTYIQNQIGKAFTDLAGGTVGQALGVVTGVGAGAGLGPSVPVDPITVKPEIQRTDKQTKATQDATEASATGRCYANPLIAKLKNALLSMLYRSIIDFANGGFNGETAIIENLQQLARDGIETVVQDFISNATAGICAKDKGEVQVMLLNQYEYEVGFSKQSQCTSETSSTGRDEDAEEVYTKIFKPQNTKMGAYMISESALKQVRAESAFGTILTYVAGQGVQPTVQCKDGTTSDTGNCPGEGLYGGKIVLTGDQKGHVIKKALTGPVDQLLNADEIGELVDAFTAGLTQFIFQGIDGLSGASQKSSSGASYLDSMVDASAGGATSGTQQAIGRDIAAAAAVEEEYFDTVSTALAGVQQTKIAYTAAIACYQLKVNTSNSALALQRIQNASTTVSTILNPQIATLTALKQKSQAALNEYDALIERAETAETQDEILQIHAEFTALIGSGRVHTTAELSTLQNDLLAASASLSILSADAVAQLNECQAL